MVILVDKNDINVSPELDIAIVESLPPGFTVLSTDREATSAWSETIKIDTRKDGSDEVVHFFAKIVMGPDATPQLHGEYTGMKQLHALSPNFVPKPHAWGRLKGRLSRDHEQLDGAFLLLDYKSFSGCLPDAGRLGARLAEMHLRSQEEYLHSNSSTDDRRNRPFGYAMVTYDGARTQASGWHSTWTSFFTALLQEAYAHDVRSNGVWTDLEPVFQRTLTHLIPRLVGALETSGRRVTPCLIHGNLWDGNVGTDSETGDPWIFDAGVYYGHNEMELGIWFARRHRLRAQMYRKSYWQNIKPSQPRKECGDRVRLYSAKTNLMHSACVPNSRARRLVYNDLVYLLDKYVPSTED